MPNPKLAAVAINAIYHGNWEYPLKKSRCQQFVREAIEEAHGEKYSEAIRADDAKSAIPKWRARGWGFPASKLKAHGGLQVGDALYKTDGEYGHVGIAVKVNRKWRVAENSSTPIGRIRGALGFRTLSQFGAFQFVGRLPESVTGRLPESATGSTPKPVIQRETFAPTDSPTVIITHWENGTAIDRRLPAIFQDGKHWMPIQDLLQEAQIEYSLSAWDCGTPNIRINPTA